MNKEKELITYLSQFVTEERLRLFRKIISLRTSYISTVLEDIYQSHNASAVLRSSDCFGIQNVHIIENSNKYIINPDVALGASKWLDLHYYNKKENNTLDAINYLKKEQFRIVATTPHTDNTLDNIDIEKGKIALFFGTELNGMSTIVKQNADEFVKIPMYGFTESFNISVSASIIFYELSKKLRSSKINWQLSEEESTSTFLNWLKESIKNSGGLVEQFYSNKK